MTSDDLPQEFSDALARVKAAFDRLPPGEHERLAAELNDKQRRTREKTNDIEFLLGRQLTKGEMYWLHRRLHYGLQVPADADLDYDASELDAAYRERLAKSEGRWRGPLDDIPPEILEQLPELD